MLIECTLKRAEPVEVSIGSDTYTFEPDDHGRRIADVYKQLHIDAFLACSHLYRPPADESAAAAPAKPAKAASDKPDRKAIVATLKEAGVPFNGNLKTEELVKLLPANSEAA